MLQAFLLQNHLPFPSIQFSMIPVSRLSQSPGTGLRQRLCSILPNHPFFLPPCHLAVNPPAMPSPSLPALTYIVPYLCCKYNIKLSREPLLCLMLQYSDLQVPLSTLSGNSVGLGFHICDLPHAPGFLRTERARILITSFYTVKTQRRWVVHINYIRQ